MSHPVLDRPGPVSDAPASDPSLERPSLATVVHRIAAALDPAVRQHGLPPGDVAALRRLEPDDLSVPAFWKVLATYVSPAGLLPRGGRALDDAERAWAVILNAMAHLAGHNDPHTSLGAALAEAGFSELRFVRLLRARGEALAPAVRTMAQFLASKAQPVNQADLAQLVLSDGHNHAESVRRRIARSYYSRTL